MSLKSKYGEKFKTADEETLKARKPKTGNSNRFQYLDKELKMYKPAEGEDKQHRVRLFPMPDVGFYLYEIRVHFGLGPDGASVCCPMFDYDPVPPGLEALSSRECPLCIRRKELYAAKKPKAAKKLRAAQYHLAQILDRLNEKEGVQPWAISGENTVNSILNLAKDPEGGVIEIDDLDSGYDLFFKRYKKGAGAAKSDYVTINDIQLGRKPTPISADEDFAGECLEYILAHPITEALRFMEPEEMEALMLSSSSSKGDEEEESEDSESTKDSADDESEERPTIKVLKDDSPEEKTEKQSEKKDMQSDIAARVAAMRAKQNAS